MQVKQVARQLKTRVEALEAEAASIRADLDVLLGETAPAKRSPNRRRSPQGAKAGRRKAAAGARAAKEVGSGRGRVGSPATQRKLKKEAGDK